MQDQQPARGQGRVQSKAFVTGPSVLISHGQVTEQPQAPTH